MNSTDLQYLLITAAKNEDVFIGRTLQSVVSQTVRPMRWLVVSDGSTDRTDEIVSRYAQEHDWIELIEMPERGRRDFEGKASSINAAYARARHLSYDIVGGLDADISFEKDYFEFLLSKFADDSQLGVAGTAFSEEAETYNYLFSSTNHVSGLYHHHRRMGYAQQRKKLLADFAFGVKDYCLGFHPVWQIFRSLYQMTRRPYVMRGAALLIGYFWAMLNRYQRSIDGELLKFQRRDQLRRLRTFFRLTLNATGIISSRPANSSQLRN